MTEVATQSQEEQELPEKRFIDLRPSQICRQCKHYYCLDHRFDHDCHGLAAETNVSFPCSYKECSNVEVDGALCPKRMLSSMKKTSFGLTLDGVTDSGSGETNPNDNDIPVEAVINWTVSIDHLPGEMLAEIFENCDYPTTQTARLVCRQFHNVLEKFHFLGPTIKYITIRNAGHQVIEVVYPRTNRQFRVSEICENEVAVAHLVNKLFRNVTSIKTLKFERIEFTEEFFLTVKKGFLKHSRNVNALLFYGCSITTTGSQLQQLINKINPTSLEFERCFMKDNFLSDKIFQNCSSQISITVWPVSNHFPGITDLTLDSIEKNLPPMVKFEDVRTNFSLPRLLDLVREVINKDIELEWDFGQLINQDPSFEIDPAVKEICSNSEDVLFSRRENEQNQECTDYKIFTYAQRSIQIKFSVRAAAVPENQEE